LGEKLNFGESGTGAGAATNVDNEFVEYVARMQDKSQCSCAAASLMVASG